MRFALHRAVVLVVTLVVAVSALFVVLHASPGSPVSNLPPSVAADPEARAAVAADAGLDRPLAVQYAAFWGSLARLDLGTSLYDGSSVSGAIAAAAPVSFQLGLMAAVVALAPGLLAGVAAARRHGRPADALVRVLTVIAISVPSYWLAVLCLVVVGERWPDLVPGAGGFTPFGQDPLGSIRSLLLPAVVLGLGGFAMVARSLRAALVGVLDGDDVHFARAMGMAEHQVLGRIALRAVAPSTVTVVGLLLGGLVSGALLVENVFALPGLGQLMLTAFTRGDHPLALGTALVTALVFLGLNLAVDVAVVALDPRTRRRLTPVGR